MYKIKRVGGSVPKNLDKMFLSYEEARTAVRKWLRSMFKKGLKQKLDGNSYLYRQPNIGVYGFSIKEIV